MDGELGRAETSERASRAGSDARTDILLVCSPGGHLLQLLALRGAWLRSDAVWVTLDRGGVRSLLDGERVYFAYGPTNRNVKNLIRNLWLAARLVPRLRPRVILTTGAGVAVPFAAIGRLFGARVVYVESLSRIDTASLSCRLIRPFAHRIYVQWPELADVIPGAIYAGNVAGG